MLAHRRLLSLMLIAALLPLAPGARAQDGPPADLEDRMIEAYENTQTYSADIAYRRTMVQGRWTRSEAAAFYVAFDRDARQLKVDLPDGVIVSDGTKLRMRFVEIPGGYLEVDAQDPLTYQSLLEIGLHIVSPMLVDVMLLLGDSPRAALQVDQATVLPTEAGDAQKRPGLSYADPAGTMVLRLDPLNHMITRYTIEPDVQSMGAPQGDSAIVEFDITIQRRNRELADDVFAFDVNDGQPFTNVQELMMHARSVQMGAGGQPVNVNHPLVGQLAPALELNNTQGNVVKVKDDDAQILILAFWTTWDDDSVAALKALQTLSETINADLADEEGDQAVGRVSIYAVNSGDTAEEIAEIYEQHKLSLPVLMDDDQATAAFAYQVQGVPTVFIVDDMRVAKVFLEAPTTEQLREAVDAIRTPQDAEEAADGETTATLDELAQPQE